jgi:hypothetical protein
MGWVKRKSSNKKRLKEGCLKYQQALEQDEIDRRNKGSGLPKDWRSRIFR